VTLACYQKPNSTVAQEHGKRTVVEGRDAAYLVCLSIVTSKESIQTPHLKELEVRLKEFCSSLMEKIF
jgi:hypothetical protein